MADQTHETPLTNAEREELNALRAAMAETGIAVEPSGQMRWVFKPGLIEVAASGGTLKTRVAGILMQTTYVIDELHRGRQRAEQDAATLRAALEKVTEHMDRAGGDGHGMPECPWCRAQGSQDGDEKWHCGNCELLLARAALASLSRPEGGQ